MGLKDIILGGGGPSEEEIQNHIPDSQKGDQVTPKSVKKILDLLDENEKVHYVGQSYKTEIDGEGHTGTKGVGRVVATDRRIAVKIPHFTKKKRSHIPYSEITSVDVETGYGRFSELKIQSSIDVYKFKITLPRGEEVREMAQFIRKKVNDPTQETTMGNEATPLEQIEKLKKLNEAGAISDEEFEEKKTQLLDKV